jgi:hypothetical protein
MEVQDGRLSQLFGSVIAMKFNSFSFHGNTSEFESDAMSHDLFPGVGGREAAQAHLITCSVNKVLCDSKLISSMICRRFVPLLRFESTIGRTCVNISMS